mgnify:CR=1 FL=1
MSFYSGRGIHQIEAVHQPRQPSLGDRLVLILSGQRVQAVQVWTLDVEEQASVGLGILELSHHLVGSGDP